MSKHLDMPAVKPFPPGTEFRIDPASPLPLHAQAERFLRELMRNPRYRNGELLPDELTLANRLGVSRGTLRAAIARLVAEGLLERKAGRGTRVTRRQQQSGMGAWRSFTQEMKRQGISVETYQLEVRELPAKDRAARALQVKAGTSVLRVDRLRGWDGEPVLHSRSWLHPRLKLSRSEDDFSRPLYEVIERRSGVVAASASEEIEAVACAAPIAELLAVAPESPVLLRRHAVFDPGGRPIEFAEIHYRSDRFTLTLEMRRESGSG